MTMRIAHYFGPGAGKSKESVYSLLCDAGHSVAPVYPDDILGLKSSSAFDILLISGGAAKTQATAIGPSGISSIRHAVKTGLGFVGICAGAYLATNYYSWSIGLVDAKVTDREHWARGKGNCKIRFSESGKLFFRAETDQFTIRYAQGPLITRPEWPSQDHPMYESLSIYESEFTENGAPEGIMPGTTAILRSSFGEGRIGLFGPHPEFDLATHSLLLRMLTWCDRRDFN